MATESTSKKEDAEVAHTSPARYVICWALLCAATVLTFLTAKANLGSWSLPVALAIATFKGAVVALFFMHLWDHRGANRLVFIVSLIFVAILIAMTLLDLNTRFPLAVPGAGQE